MQRRIEALLDEADTAISAQEWARVAGAARAVLAIDHANADALGFLAMAEANRAVPAFASAPTPEAPAAASAPAAVPESFAAGRYHVRRFLGEGGKKRVFLAHDELLDRDVAFALIKTDGLDDVGRERITREAQAMGRLGAHPNLVTIFDIGEEGGAPFVVTELMGGGDVEAVLAESVPPLTRTLEIAKGVARGLAFAHAQGIVHRDLKPGNVWLSADGVAKIGDFGLAVALNRSRLTLHGLMVGTVAYMPPEQALGGEVTPQADLYSLGAMLYELVTGRPPFQGDSPTAVISQHINSTPVGPSWNSEHCPPELEALILKLLAKVPADRPASATEVVTALERVDPEARSASHSDSQANPLDRLARGVFVGRENELERLRAALDEALGGHGSVVMLVGEPGVGKTRTTQELETYARMRGAQVLWGRANEAGGAPPFWPWLLAGRSYRAQNSDDIRRKEFGPYATELQRIFPALRDLFPNLPAPPPVDSDEGQFQLFDAMSGFLHAVAERVPLMVVLDDLHWADRATLQLLSHLARDLARTRILVLGTYRDTDLDRRHPLSQALGEMNREALFLRVPLRGLGEAQVRDYIARAAGVEPARELARRVFEETEGNPFFLSEVVNLMAQEGTFSATSVSAVAIPEGVREALGRRLDRLSEEANGLLTKLAVAGREFDHRLVRTLGGHDEQTTLQLIEEALAARVIEETAVTGAYRFTHALMQETLLDELSAARRVLLHGQTAAAFETLYGPDDRDHLAALANHYAESALLNHEHARSAVHYLRAAGNQSEAALSYSEAADQYDRCLSIMDQAHDVFGEDDAALWGAVAMCRKATGDLAIARSALDQALTRYRERHDIRGQARLLLDYILAQASATYRMEGPRLDELIVAMGDEDSVELCRLLAASAMTDLGPRGDALAERASSMALRLGLVGASRPVPLSQRAWNVLNGRGAFLEAAALAESMEVEPGSPATSLPMQLKSISLAYAGDIEAWKTLRGAYLAAVRREHRRGLEAIGVADLAAIAWRRGARQEFDGLIAAADMNTWVGLIASSAAAVDGETIEALRLLSLNDGPQATPGRQLMTAALRVNIQCGAGDGAAAQSEFNRIFADWPQWGSTDRIGALGWADIAVIELADDTVAGAIAAFLQEVSGLRCYTGQWGGLGNPDVLRGRLALRFEKLDEAEQHFRTGLDWAARPDVRFVIDQGRCLQGLAEVDEHRGNIETAREHLDAAGEFFAKYGAKLYLDQVLAKKQVLRA